jgi:hypothetical protein
MILPNAWFYKYSNRIVHYVDGKKKGDGTPLPIYYPEREYKNAHNTKASVYVLGHSVLITYRVAAHYVNNILTGYWTNLPAFQEAVQDSSFWRYVLLSAWSAARAAAHRLHVRWPVDRG